MLFRKDNSDKENKNSDAGKHAADGVMLPGYSTPIVPYTDGDGGEYIPRHLAESSVHTADSEEEYLTTTDGCHIAANGAVIRRPTADQPEILPDHEYTEENEDLNLLIM